MKLQILAAAAALAVLSLPAAAATQTFQGALTPEAAFATGTGYVTAVYDSLSHKLDINASFSGLSGTTTVAHIHCCVAAPGTVGVAVTPGTLPGFQAGVSAGSYSIQLDLTQSTTYTAGFRGVLTLAQAEAKLIEGLEDGLAYFNVHTSAFPAGEIRTFLAPIPEPSTYALMALGLLATGAAARRRRT